MILGFVLGIILLVWTLWPLFHESGLLYVSAGETSRRAEEAQQVRESQLQELEDDFAMGRLDADDYQRLKDDLETVERPAVEAQEAKSSTGDKIFCIHCGQANPKEARFCMACGREIDYA